MDVAGAETSPTGVGERAAKHMARRAGVQDWDSKDMSRKMLQPVPPWKLQYRCELDLVIFVWICILSRILDLYAFM